MIEKQGGIVDESSLHREVTIMRKISNHPHIVRIYELQDTATELFLFNEFCSGGELFDYICKKRRLSESESRSFFQQLISALCYCHCNSIVHRDLKPENIMLNEKRTLKLCDFGLSNFNEDGRFLRTFCGSPNYAAPEIVSGKPYVAPETDVWSCGVILYAMLCGYLPFDEVSLSVLFDKIRAGDFKVPAFLTASAQDLITRMIVVDPYKRLTLKEVRRHPWFDASLPEEMKINFLYGPLPPLSGLVTRKHLMRRYGLPAYSDQELRTLFDIDKNGRHLKSSICSSLSRNLNLSSKHLAGAAGGVDYLSDPTHPSFYHTGTLLRADEDAMLLLDSNSGIEDLDTELICDLAALGYDMSDPVKVIDPMLRPDVYPSPETVAYHLLMDARKGEARMPVQTACYLGITYMSIRQHGLPGDIITDRQVEVIKANSEAYIKMELANLTFNTSKYGAYQDRLQQVARIAPPNINDPSQMGDNAFECKKVISDISISSTTPSTPVVPFQESLHTSASTPTDTQNLFKLLPIAHLNPQDWSKFPTTFPKEIQRKVAACAVFRNDLAESSVHDICSSLKLILPRLKRKKKTRKRIPDEIASESVVKEGAIVSSSPMRNEVEFYEPPDVSASKSLSAANVYSSMRRRRSRLPSMRERYATGSPISLQPLQPSARSFKLSYTLSPEIIQRELLKIISDSGYLWKTQGYGKWVCRKKVHIVSVEDELKSMQNNVRKEWNDKLSLDTCRWGDMFFISRYASMPSDGASVMLVQILSLEPTGSRESGNCVVRHIVDILHLSGPLARGLVQAQCWVCDLDKALKKIEATV
eukprot:GHVH01008788.1.p1 GENE.GHVH01008788.1~~GHVH01008788.1.p1  ORF type:complete len:938 (+),score=110.21 GHVH01008788.1:370-2814(+)